MPNSRRTVILGVKFIGFARNGTVDGEDGTVGVDYAPAITPAVSELYDSLGDGESASINVSEDTITLRSPRSGKYRKRKSLVMGIEHMIIVRMQDVTQLTFESLFRFSGAITIGTAQQPGQQSDPITGFVYLDLTDQTGTSIIKGRIYCELRWNKYQIQEKEYGNDLEIAVLENSLNSVNLAALTAMAN